MKNILVAVDVDGVMADFTSQFIRYYNLAHQDDIIKKEDIVDYMFSGLKYEANEEQLWLTPGFISTLNIIGDAKNDFKELCETFSVIVVTACDASVAQERIEWFKEHFPWFDKKNIIFTERKNLVKFDYIIDDSPSIIQLVGPEKSICMNQCYNQHLTSFYRVDSLKEAICLIKRLNGRKVKPTS